MLLLLIALIAFFLLYGLVGMGWITLNNRVLAVIALIIAALYTYILFTGHYFTLHG